MAIARIPEDDIVMDSQEAVAAFDEAGLPGGPLFPVYHFNATRLSRLLPKGSTVLDLFCGSGQLLRHLLIGRPDVHAIGVDLSSEMLSLARDGLDRLGVGDRVDLRLCDAALADEVVPEQVGVVASLSALHHCPTFAALTSVLAAIARIRMQSGCGVWLFDLVRPDSEALVELLPRAHETRVGKSLPEVFIRDWSASLRAGWTFAELSEAARQAGLQLSGHEANFSQLHWCPSITGSACDTPAWSGPPRNQNDSELAENLANTLGIEL